MRSFKLAGPLGAAFVWLALANAAHADPCRAIPDAGPMPDALTKGAVFIGPVVYVGDGDSLCVAATRGRESDPTTWVEVRVADFYAPELNAPGGRDAKGALEQLALHRQAHCIAGRRTYDRVAARCAINGLSIGTLMRRAGVREGGNGR